MRQLCGAHVRVNLHGLVPCHLCMFVSSEWFISIILVVCAGSSFFFNLLGSGFNVFQ